MSHNILSCRRGDRFTGEYECSGAFALDSAATGYENVFNYLAPLTNPELREEAERILPLGISETEETLNGILKQAQVTPKEFIENL
ncbi:MAG: hypothetical protein V7K98_08395 [Nostoc sp.]|uniref:hypothetical protein n=1 Tax=Nostoc sp. TaxID=1180 RepID=UPI002FFD3B91